MNTVKQILKIEGVENHDDYQGLEPNTHYTVVNEPYMDLEIEKYMDDEIQVSHNYIQNGDLMSDPLAGFDPSDWDAWVPVRLRQDSHPAFYDYDELGLDDGARDFIREWDQRLERQGFVEAAKNG